MKAIETNFTKFLSGNKQFTIPIYQRTYSWNVKQCQQLWEDILRIAQDTSVNGHFAGSIVYIENGIYNVASVPNLLVIDGQQRLTTLTLLMTALAEAIEASGEESGTSARKIRNTYLINNEEEGDKRYRMVLTQNDKSTLQAILDGHEIPEDGSIRIRENYEFFKKCIAESDLSHEALLVGIGKLIVIDVSLDRDRDNPQLIFESMNSTGLDLTQADLIRNYVLMGLEPTTQERIYREIWRPMEINFGQVGYTELFDRFMRDYLTVKTRKIPNILHVYESFKDYIRTQDDFEAALTEIQKYSKLFATLAFNRESDEEIAAVITDINALRIDVAYPFILELLNDYRDGAIDKQGLITLLRLVETYVFRRSICEVPTNSLNKTFSTISAEIDKSDYVKSTLAAFQLKEAYLRLPSDREFSEALQTRDVYNYRNRNYMLRKLENHGRKEVVNVDAFTVEHVMPQTLTETWIKSLGDDYKDVHDRYLHGLGNLTLTGYNPEYSNHPFSQKKTMQGGFNDSPLYLNKSIKSVDTWDSEAIQHRAKLLADKAVEIWDDFDLSEEELAPFKAELEASRPKKAVQEFDIEHHIGNKYPIVREMFDILRSASLGLSPNINEDVVKSYVAYRTSEKWYVTLKFYKKKIQVELWSDATDDSEVAYLSNYGSTILYVQSLDEAQQAAKLIETHFSEQ